MTLWNKMITAMEHMFLDNLFFVILMIALTLLVLDYYGRFLKVVKTDQEDIVERYIWLEYARRTYAKKP